VSRAGEHVTGAYHKLGLRAPTELARHFAAEPRKPISRRVGHALVRRAIPVARRAIPLVMGHLT
jgi:hypothetical protein